jgi:hypothetical protein
VIQIVRKWQVKMGMSNHLYSYFSFHHKVDNTQRRAAIAIATLIASVLSLLGSSTMLLSYVLYSKGTGVSY